MKMGRTPGAAASRCKRSGAGLHQTLSLIHILKHSKEPETFGMGRLEGIAASESANSAVVASSLIPLFTLGIPGNIDVYKRQV